MAVVPNFLVAGAARAGTTALIEGLRLHPDVFVTQPKEPHYFAYHGLPIEFKGPGDDQWVNKVVVNDLEKYLGLFSAAGDTPARGDGSVTTLYFADRAAGEILRVNPEMRIIVLLREPVARAFSSFAYLRLRGAETETDFRRALDVEASRKAAGWHHMWHYDGMSRYASDLRTLYDVVGRSQVRVWFYDDLQANYEQVLNEVVAFLELQPFPTRSLTMPRVNVSGAARLVVAQRLIHWATEHESVRSAIKRVVPFETRERVRSSIVRRQDLSTATLDDLAPRFAGDLTELAALLPENQPHWLGRYAFGRRCE